MCTYIHTYLCAYIYTCIMCHLLLLYCVHILCCVGYSWSTVDISIAFEPDTGLSKGSAVDTAFVTDDKVTVMYIVCGDNAVCCGIVSCPVFKKTNKDIYPPSCHY